MADFEEEYFAAVLAYTRRGLHMSIVFAVVGALVILAGAVKILFFAGDHAALLSGVYTAVCGAITEGIATLLHIEADRGHRRMTELLDRARSDRLLAANASRRDRD